MSLHEGAGNQTWVLCKSSQVLMLNHLPALFVFEARTCLAQLTSKGLYTEDDLGLGFPPLLLLWHWGNR